ncbi:MAG: hypothetical protein H6624_12980 [Bdellovibrionaceae bacterium]|nr:hypothetical protein [Bdellovibrionales bacterium]MCB9085257.1 hypothetical protein [Pseudobdellovibrionaceae bacterium]
MTKAWRITTLFAVLTVTAAAWSERKNISIWEQIKRDTTAVSGRVKSIAVDDNTREITVRLASREQGSILIKVCPEYNGQLFRHVMNQDKMALLRQAMNDGREVKVSTGGSFDSCVAHVEATSI